MLIRSLRVLAVLCCTAAAWLPAQVDLTAAQQELDKMFERPAGQVISEAQKDALHAFVVRYEGQDLKHLGYVRALDCYFARDVVAGALVLDEFFKTNDKIANTEHATMAGRIYLSAVREEAGKADANQQRLASWGERMVALYPDLNMLNRIAAAVTANMRDASSFRLGMVRGLMHSSASAAAKDEFLQSLYGSAAGQQGGGKAADTVPARPVRAQLGTARGETIEAAAVVGKPAPDIKVEQVLGGGTFAAADYRGKKVLVLDFFATWCGPCRAGIKDLVHLQQELGDQVQVVALTRFYGRGMDFADDSALPHGGKGVSNLSKEEELAVNERLVKRFGINYPVVFTDEATSKEGYGVSGIPTAFVIGKDGTLLGKVVGSGEKQHKELRELIANAAK